MLLEGGPSTQVGHVGAVNQLGLFMQFRSSRALARRLPQTFLVGTATVIDSDLEAALRLLALFRDSGMEQEEDRG